MTDKSVKASGCLQATFRSLAEGGLVKENFRFGIAIQSAIREELTTRQDVARLLGVQPEQVFAKANSLKPSEIKKFCKKLSL